VPVAYNLGEGSRLMRTISTKEQELSPRFVRRPAALIGALALGNPGYVITDGIVHWTGSLTTTNPPNTGYPGNYFAMVPSGVDAGRCLNAPSTH
jgi:hypothetical protein